MTKQVTITLLGEPIKKDALALEDLIETLKGFMERMGYSPIVTVQETEVEDVGQ